MWTTVIIACAVVILIFRYFKSKYSVFKKLGIPGPPPSLLFGNLMDLLNRKGSDHQVILNWSRKYGKLFGFYNGGQPVLVSSDPDLAFEILVKQFHIFPGRRRVPHLPKPDAKEGVSMFGAEGARWKRLRLLSNPMFTGAKLKQLEPTVHNCLAQFMDNIDEKFLCGEAFDIYELYQALTLDVIGQTAFGLTTNCQKNLEDPLLLTCKEMFQGNDVRVSLFGTLIAIFPEFPFWRNLVKILPKFSNRASSRIPKMVAPVVEKLRKEYQVSKQSLAVRNFITMMLEAELTDNDVDLDTLSSLSAEENGGEAGALKVEKKMTANEIVGQMGLFLLAGYETTSTALGYATYLLARNPDALAKLLAEIDEAYASDGKKEGILTFENIKKLKYLDCIAKETLRLYPIAFLAVVRRAKEEFTFNGLTVPAGMEIQIDVSAIHQDPNLWGPDPEEFRPERHFDEPKHPMAWLPFGGGPRFCIGMRFALMEMKLALATILHKYKFEPSKQTMKPLKLRTQGTLQPEEGIWISLSKR